jgi:hypothetical protein
VSWDCIDSLTATAYVARVSEIDAALERRRTADAQRASEASRSIWLTENFGGGERVVLHPIPTDLADLVDQFFEMAPFRQAETAWLVTYQDGSIWRVATRRLNRERIPFRLTVETPTIEDHDRKLREHELRTASMNDRVRTLGLQAFSRRLYFGGDFESPGWAFDRWRVNGEFCCEPAHGPDRRSFADKAAEFISGYEAGREMDLLNRNEMAEQLKFDRAILASVREASHKTPKGMGKRRLFGRGRD